MDTDTVYLYDDPEAMLPMSPNDESGKLEELAIKVLQASSALNSSVHRFTRDAIADFLRPMNSYYSNLIEGHDTHPIDIDKALVGDYHDDIEKKNLQIEAHAHIKVHRELCESGIAGSPSSSTFLQELHRRFYVHLPDEFMIINKGNKKFSIQPGEFRDGEVSVGTHKAPVHTALPRFMERFESAYDPESKMNRSKIKRIINIAASHHRFAWIHPFYDGNGRVVRLYSDACFMFEGIDSSGLWSVSRGLARQNDEYKERLAEADSKRLNDYDGRGNLSERRLYEFCSFFLKTALDQISFMRKSLDTDLMLERIKSFVQLMKLKTGLRAEAELILTQLFLKGVIAKTEAMQITGFSDKTLKNLIEELEAMGFLFQKLESNRMKYFVRYPIKYSPAIFPGLYPSSKEVGMMGEF